MDKELSTRIHAFCTARDCTDMEVRAGIKYADAIGYETEDEARMMVFYGAKFSPELDPD